MPNRPNSSETLQKKKLAASRRLMGTASSLVKYGQALNSAALALLFVFIAGTAANLASNGSSDLSMIGKALHAIFSLLSVFGIGLILSSGGRVAHFFSDIGDILQIKKIAFRKNKIISEEESETFDFVLDMFFGIASTCWAIAWICYIINSLINADYSKVHW